jgi:hypothetical protein
MENEPQGTADGDLDEEEPGLIETIVERMRGTGVGTEDPNIVGDVGPTDVPPGRDPDSVWPPPDPSAGGSEDPEAPA